MIPVSWALMLALGATPQVGDEARFEVLARLQGGAVVIDDPANEDVRVPERSPGPVLDVDTARQVIRKERPSLWACREYVGDRRSFVLDLSIRSTGRVRDLSLRPSPGASQLLACARKATLRWRFPPFSGEREDGRTVEVVNLSVPIRFAD